MKSPLFLLGPLLICVPCAFGQTAPVAVQVPVAGAATVMPTDAELQAKVDAAAQALAKLPANTPGLATAQERVAAARGLIVVPAKFSLGQGDRQVRLVLENLRSARVWCETSAKIAEPNTKVSLNQAIQRLQDAENVAQQKVDVLDKPDNRTPEQIQADLASNLEKSRAFLEASKQRSIASDKAGAEVTRKLQEALKAIEAFPEPVPVDEQKEELADVTTPEVQEAIAQEREMGQRFASDAKDYSEKLNASVELSIQLSRPGLTPSQKSKMKADSATANEEKEVARSNFYSSYEKLRKSQEKVTELLKTTNPQKVAAWHNRSSGFTSLGFRLIQNNQPTIPELKAARDAAQLAKEQARELADNALQSLRIISLNQIRPSKDLMPQ